MQRRNKFMVCMVLAAMLCCLGGEALCSDNASRIDPKAEMLIAQLGEQSRQRIGVKIEVFDTMDEVLESGQKIQHAHIRSAAIRRPDRLMMESRGDVSNTTFFKDAALFTILDRDQNAYAQVPAPGSIEEAADLLFENYGLSTPLIDIISSDISSVLLTKVLTCRYLGLHYAGARPCHHIAATQDAIDWQVWLDQEGGLLLRKIVITYKLVPGQPQYSATLERFELAPDLPDETFAFQPPPGAEKIKLVPAKKEKTKKQAR